MQLRKPGGSIIPKLLPTAFDPASIGKALQDATEALSKAQSVDEIVAAVLAIASRALTTRAACFYEIEDDRIWLRHSFSRGVLLKGHDNLQLSDHPVIRKLVEGFQVPDAYLGSSALQPRQTTIIDHEAGTVLPGFDDWAKLQGWTLELNIPLFTDHAVIGALCLYRGANQSFSAAEIGLSETLAKLFTLAIQVNRSKLLEKEAAVALHREQAAQERAVELARASKLLRDYAERINTGTEITEVLSIFLAETVALSGGSEGALVRRANGNEFEIAAQVQDGAALDHQRLIELPTVKAMRERSSADGAGYLSRILSGEITFEKLDDLAGWFPEAFEWHGSRGNKMTWNIPFRIGAEVQGYLSIAFRDERKPTPVAKETMAALALQIGGALQLIQSVEAGKQAAVAREREQAALERAAELTKVNDALRRSFNQLVSVDNVDAFIESTLHEAIETSGAVSGAIFLLKQQDVGFQLRCLFIRGEKINVESDPRAALWRRPIPADHLSIRPMADDFVWINYRQQPLFNNDFEMHAWHREQGHGFAPSLLLRFGEQVVGLFALAYDENVDFPFTPTRLELCHVLAQQCALALRFSSLTEEVKRNAIAREQQRAAQVRVAELGRTNVALKQILDMVAFEADLDKVLGQVLTAISKQLDSSSSALWLLSKTSGRFQVRFAYHNGQTQRYDDNHQNEMQQPWGRGRDLLLKTHVNERRPVVYQVEDLKLTRPAAFEFFQARGVRTLLGVPLLIGAEIAGSLTIRFMKHRVLSTEELALTQSLAHQATLAIQLTNLGRRAGEAAVTEERNRFAREIHDTLAQGFTGILMQLGAAAQNASGNREALQPYLDSMEKLALSSLVEARRSVKALRPVIPRSQFDAALLENVDRIRMQTRAEVRFQQQGNPFALDELVEDELLRIAGESLANAAKHAGASVVDVYLDWQSDGLTISVKDDGVGFNPESRVFAGSYGLAGMQERSARIRANLTVVSEVGRGTEIIVQWRKYEE